MIGLPAGTQIWLAVGVTDLRRGFTGLSGMVQTKLEQDPFAGHVFLFRGRRGDLIKMLWWDGDGLCNPSTENPQYRVCAQTGLLSVAPLVWS
jgi:transposase